MKRSTITSVAASIALAATLVATGLPNAAHASARSHNAVPTGCHTLRVHLNGHNLPDFACADVLDAAGNPIPATQPAATLARWATAGILPAGFAQSAGKARLQGTSYRNNCDSNDIHLYDSTGQTGNSVCIYGLGFINMTDVPFGFFNYGNWNDRASSWSAGGYCSTYYSDIDGGGNSFPDFAFDQDNFANTPVGDKALSSIAVNANYPC